MHLEQNKQLELCLLCVICDRDRLKVVEDVLKNRKMFFSTITYGKGTASSRILNYLGLGETEKAVFCCFIHREEAEKASVEVDKVLELAKPGHGILFMAGIDSGCYQKPVAFATEENKEGNTQMDALHDLIIVVLNRGYCEDVMESARGAGATGGTVMNARGCGAASLEKFFGMVIAPEKELIWIVTKKSVTTDIMAAIAANVGPGTDASAVSFSLTVNNLQGINLEGLAV